MPNAHVNKVVYGSDTLIDLTSDTITAENVIEGYTFHGADGSTVEGTLTHLTNAEIDEITGGGGGSSEVTVSPLNVTSNGTYTAPSGTAYSPVTVAVPTPAPSLQSKSVTPSTSQQTVSPDSGYDGLSAVTVGAISSEYIVPSGSTSITANGTVDVTDYASAVVSVPGWELLASTEMAVSTTSTSAASAGTVNLGSGAYTDTDVIWVHIRDTAGPRAGYFYGSDAIFVNVYKANDTTTAFNVPGVEIVRYTTSGAYAATAGQYGVYGYSISSAGVLTVRRRYNSNYSLTINGTFTVQVYKLSVPSGMTLFE